MSPHVNINREQIIIFCQKRKISELSFFGSVLRDDFTQDSDIDILVEFFSNSGWSLYEWIDMQQELETMFNRKVDLVSKKGIRNPYRRKAILSDREVFYAA